MFKFVAEGAKQFAKDVDQAVTKTKAFVDDVNAKVQEKVNEIAMGVKAQAEEIAKVVDGEAKKFMKVAQKAYNDVAATAQKVTQGAVDFMAQNADLLKTINGATGAFAAGLVSFLPQALSAIPVWCVILSLASVITPLSAPHSVFAA